MAEHTPEDIEFMARLARAMSARGDSYSWERYRDHARRALDWMAANGVKMMPRPEHNARMAWDAAPLVPTGP